VAAEASTHSGNAAGKQGLAVLEVEILAGEVGVLDKQPHPRRVIRAERRHVIELASGIHIHVVELPVRREVTVRPAAFDHAPAAMLSEQSRIGAAPLP